MVTVIVPCRNERAHIDAFLNRLAAQQTRWEAWIADGMSTDGTRARILERAGNDARIHLIDNPGGSAASGLNAALAISAIAQQLDDIVIRMDVHTWYADDYISQCVATLQRTGADNVGGPWIAYGVGYRQRAIAAAFQSRFCSGGARSHDSQYEGPVDSVYLGCWRRATLDRIGWFDASLVRNQDDEWNLRLMRAGGVVWQSPAIRSRHRARATLTALARQYFDYGYWKPAVIRKHRMPGSWRHLAPGAFILVNAIVLPMHPYAALILDAPYLVASLLFSLTAARRSGWSLLPLLPVVFAIYHFSYGIGFLSGCCQGRSRTHPA